ncbi:hypothetical protein ACFE04_031357 [Oxalis oulophora]
MAASSAPFYGIREENQIQMIQQQQQQQQQQLSSSTPTSSSAPTPPAPPKKKRNQPGNPSKYPDAEVIALSPKTLMATNRFICEKTTKEVRRKVYLCPEPTCVHHDPSRALGDLTGIKKHYYRKHGEKKWKCEKCSKRYAVQSDWKAHSKTCGTREYRCDCGTLFSRRDSFITHRAFCDALAQESARNPTSSLHSIGTSAHHLYGNNNHMSLGLSSQVVSQLQDHQQNHHGHGQHPNSSSHNILRLGGSGSGSGSGGGPKFEHLINPNPSNQSAGFFMTHHDPNQAFQDHSNSHGGGGGGFKSSSLGLIQLPDLQTGVGNTTNPNLFNLGFFSNNSNSNSDHHHHHTSANNNSSSNLSNSGLLLSPSHNQAGSSAHHLFSCDQMGDVSNVGSGISSLYNTSSMQHESMISPHMSATALLQKAAQMGSTTSSNTASSTLLRGLATSSSSGGKSDKPPAFMSAANFANHFGSGSSQIENGININTTGTNLQGLIMNSLANGGFGGDHDNNSFTSFNGMDHENSPNFVNDHHQPNNNKMNASQIGASMGGNDDKLTLDFLGVGGMVTRNNMGGGFSQDGLNISSIDSQLK